MSTLRRFASRTLILLLVGLAWASHGCRQSSSSDRGVQATPSVWAVNEPLATFARRIGGDTIEVTMPFSDPDPSVASPDRETLMGFQQADLILCNGAGYADWIEWVSLPRSRMVNTSRHGRDRYIELAEMLTHSHGDAGEHQHVQHVGQTWSDPLIVSNQVDAVRDALVELLPANAAIYTERAAGLKQELSDLDARLALSLGRMSPVIFNGDGYRYLQRAHASDSLILDWPGSKPPTRDQLDQLPDQAQVMIWRSPPSEEVTRLLQEQGLRVVVIHVDGGRGDSGRDYVDQLELDITELESMATAP